MAEEITPTPAPAAPPPSSDGGGSQNAPSSSPGAATAPPASGEGGSLGSAPASAPTGTPEPTEPHVPWGKFREVQTQFTTAKRQWGESEGQYKTRLADLETKYAEAQKYRDDFTVLEQLLAANPDLADSLYQRASNGTPAPGTRPGAAAPAQMPPEFQQLLKDVQDMKGVLTNAQKADLQRQQAQQDARDNERLDTTIKKYLAERELDDEMLPIARAFVLQKVREGMHDLSFEEVPFVLNDLYKPMHKVMQAQMERIRNGKVNGQGSPPIPGASPPVVQIPKPGATDMDTARALEEALTQRGWTNSGQ